MTNVSNKEENELFLRKFWLHEDSLLSNRFNFFILMETVFLMSYATCKVYYNWIVCLAISIIALIITTIFLIVFERTRLTLNILKNELQKPKELKDILPEHLDGKNGEYKDNIYYRFYKLKYGKLKSIFKIEVNLWLGVCVTVLFISLWIFLFLYAFLKFC